MWSPGSITVDGISLTVNRCEKTRFYVNIIPHTAAGTTLGVKKASESVNIETDILARYVEKLITADPEGSGGKGKSRRRGGPGPFGQARIFEIDNGEDMSVSTIKEAIVDIKSGRMVILVDDEDRENEGDLCMAAQFVTAETINFMARYGRGLICLTLTEEEADKLHLMPMVRDNRSRFGTAFTVSIEAKQGVTTGISAADRATTVLAAVADGARPDDLVSPGHIFPIRAKRGASW